MRPLIFSYYHSSGVRMADRKKVFTSSQTLSISLRRLFDRRAFMSFCLKLTPWWSRDFRYAFSYCSLHILLKPCWASLHSSSLAFNLNRKTHFKMSSFLAVWLQGYVRISRKETCQFFRFHPLCGGLPSVKHTSQCLNN